MPVKVHVPVLILPALLWCAVLMSTSTLADEAAQPARRMGAYQCIDCASGGVLTGIRQGGYGRVLRKFPPHRRLCVASYRNIGGEQYVFFQLLSMMTKTDGAWTIRRERSTSGVNPSGERYARIQLDDGGWPDGGGWGVQSNSWNAECHDAKVE